MNLTRTNVPNFQSLKHVHILGVCGTLMGAFAAFLKRRGVRVTGSDQNVYPPMSDVLKNAGVELISGYAPANLDQLGSTPDLVVVGNVISAANVEMQEVVKRKLNYLSLPEAMESLLLKETDNLVVCGTHGKTTTSSLLAHTLVSCMKDPAYFIGGVSKDLPFSFHIPEQYSGKPFVLEGDEYDTAYWDKVPKFSHYLPKSVILTSIEYDHADIYPDFEAVKKVFRKLVQNIDPVGRLIACFEDPVVKEISKLATVPVFSYGLSQECGAQFVADSIVISEEQTTFRILENQNILSTVSIRLSGKHNVLNALSVWVLCYKMGIPRELVTQAFASFQGVKRRQEVVFRRGNLLVIDDFAHHPTAVRETLSGLRAKYPKQRLLVIFEPRSATSRRKIFQSEYGKAFGVADGVWIAKPFDTSKIPAKDQFSSEQLIEDLVRAKKDAHLMETVETGVASILSMCDRNDCIVVLSNGGFGGFIPKLIEGLRTKFEDSLITSV